MRNRTPLLYFVLGLDAGGFCVADRKATQNASGWQYLCRVLPLTTQKFRDLVFLFLLACSALIHNSQALANGIESAKWVEGFDNNFGLSIWSVPGGVAMVDIGPERLPSPSVHWGDKKILVQKNSGRWQALVGIPLSTKPGRYELSVFSTIARKTAFRVSARRYPQQLLTISDISKVTPPAAALERIRVERGSMSAARHAWRDEFDAETFRIPLEGRHTSRFGLRRLYNGKPGNRHSGLDLAAPTGTPIVSPAAGVVVEVGDFYFNGKSVFIDHGQGLVSLYSHLSDTGRKVGDRVLPGDEVGLVGATGRVTGPHLHWSVGLNGVWVDPELFLRPVQ